MNFAVLDSNGNILNTIVADSKEIAEQVTEKTCIEFITEPAEIGGFYDFEKKIFIKRQPYPSWELDINNEWQAPVAYPMDNKIYLWNEDIKSWDEIVQ